MEIRFELEVRRCSPRLEEMIWLVLGFVGAVIGTECGKHLNPTLELLSSPANFILSENRLVGGIETIPHSWPWTVQILYKGKHHCGGALINKRFVVTAAHCFARNQSIQLYLVLLGGHKSKSGIPHRVTDISVHNLYNVVFPAAYDIALVKIDPPAIMTEEVLPICLPTLPVPDNKICVVTGWGRIEEVGNASESLREIHVPIVPLLDCILQFHGRIHLPSMMCAGYDSGLADSCQGDSGGPLMCNSNGRWEVQGLVSWGIGCGRPGITGVYTSVFSVSTWIQIEMWKLGDN